MKTTHRLVCICIALICLCPAAFAAEQVALITEIGDRVITLDDGRRIGVSDDTKIIKPGYELTWRDLRPGWAIQSLRYAPDYESSSPVLTKLKVAALPLANEYPPYSGLRDVVAIGAVEMGLIPAGLAMESIDFQQAVGTITSAVLRATGRFNVVDRAARPEVLNEGDFGASGYVNVTNAPEGGRILSADYLVKVSVVDFDHFVRTGTATGVGGVKWGKNKSRSKLTIELRMVNLETGEVVESVDTTRLAGTNSRQIRVNLAELANSGIAFVGDDNLDELTKLASTQFTFAKNNYMKSPIGELFSLALNDLVEQLVENWPETPWYSVVVVAVDPDTFVVRGGTDAGLSEGAILSVETPGEELMDPETGESLGRLGSQIGEVRIIKVHDKVSIVRRIAGDAIQIGDLCFRAKGGGS